MSKTYVKKTRKKSAEGLRKKKEKNLHDGETTLFSQRISVQSQQKLLLFF